MAVRVEPLRGRPSSKGPSTYPGLTPEERGVEPLAPPEILPEPPLWVLPSGMPLERRPTGFVPPLPPPLGIDLQPPEGLFDVGPAGAALVGPCVGSAPRADRPGSAGRSRSTGPAGHRPADAVPERRGPARRGGCSIPGAAPRDRASPRPRRADPATPACRAPGDAPRAPKKLGLPPLLPHQRRSRQHLPRVPEQQPPLLTPRGPGGGPAG